MPGEFLRRHGAHAGTEKSCKEKVLVLQPRRHCGTQHNSELSMWAVKDSSEAR
jgi:hypothetical protein